MHISISCMFKVVITLVTVMLTAPLVAEDWPQFRGPAGNATSVDSVIPLRWTADENIVWKSELPGRGSSSPIIWGDRIFLTAFTGYGMTMDDPGDKSNLELHLLCFDRTSGALIWDRSVKASAETQDITQRVIDHGYATSTPVTDGEKIFAFFGATGVVAWDWNGNQLWHSQVGTGHAGFGSAASPVLYQNLVIVNASIESDTVFAFDKSTGATVWTIPNTNRTWTTPCVAELPGGKHELIVNQKDTIFGYDPLTGKQLWTCEGIDDYIVPVPIANDGVVYCLGGRQNRFIAVRLGGRGDVTETHKLWEVNVGANVTSPIYHAGLLYWASDKSIANCVDAKTGESIYRERLPTRARIYASMIRAGDYLLVTTRDEGIVVLPAKPEYEELAINTIETDDNLFNAGPAVSDGQLFIRSDAYLYCIGKVALN